VRRAPVQWDRALIMRTIQDRARDQESLASSKAPPHFVAAARGERTLTRALHHAVQRYFGGVHAARAAAGLPALLRTAWTRPMMIAELQARARFGRKGVGRLLRQPAIRLFGSIEAALADAARAEPWRSTRQPEVGRMSSDEPMQL
jgi:hypothetical protein